MAWTQKPLKKTLDYIWIDKILTSFFFGIEMNLRLTWIEGASAEQSNRKLQVWFRRTVPRQANCTHGTKPRYFHQDDGR